MVLYKKLSVSCSSEEDMRNYKTMLITTPSALTDNDIKQGLKGSRTSKYVVLISKLVKKEEGWLPDPIFFLHCVYLSPRLLNTSM